jgi:hypothetical protein
VDLDGLAEHVGPERFRQACARAWATAPSTGKARDAEDGPGMVPHELEDLVEGDLSLAMGLYRAMPCYANLMYVEHWAGTEAWFAELRSLLDDPAEELAAPAAYWLWCGPFEGADAESVAAWNRMLIDASDRRLRRLVHASGPVPWSAKEPVLVELAGDQHWHPAIWAAVRHAVGDVFGRVDAGAALRLLTRLGLPPDGIDAEALRATLRDRQKSRRDGRVSRSR